MCGILGFNFSDQNLVKKGCELLKHRGPDNTGYFLNEAISFGQTRLSIIDLNERANQPFEYTHNQKTVVVNYNGEIYNFQVIKEELQDLGYTFDTSSDTEVIAASYFEYGEQMFNHFNGMWALAIYDESENKIILSRDRFGQKPLFYYLKNKDLIFSSAISPIRLIKKLKDNEDLNINPQAINYYLNFGFIPSPNTIYENIYKLTPRTSLSITLNDMHIKHHNYYKPSIYKPSKKSISELKLEFEDLIKNAVNLRTISDVPIGILISGGIDSSTVLHFLSKLVDISNLHSFSIGFEDELDETKYIYQAVDTYKTIHHHKYYTFKDFEKNFSDLPKILNEPFHDISIFPSLKLYELCSEKVKVVLSGDAGDEITGGYGYYNKAVIANLLNKKPQLAKFILRKYPKRFPKSTLVKNAIALADGKLYEIDSYVKFRNKKTENWLENTFNESMKISNNSLPEAIRLHDLLYFTLPDNYLHKVDHSSMHHSLEVRSPFMDYRLVELSQIVPTKLKYTIKTNRKLFKEVMKEKLPKSIVRRKKQGFIPPVYNWMNEYYDFEQLNSSEFVNDNKSLFDNISYMKLLKQDYFKFRMMLISEWYKSNLPLDKNL